PPTGQRAGGIAEIVDLLSLFQDQFVLVDLRAHAGEKLRAGEFAEAEVADDDDDENAGEDDRLANGLTITNLVGGLFCFLVATTGFLKADGALAGGLGLGTLALAFLLALPAANLGRLERLP